MPKEEFKQEVEKELTGRETEPWEIVYFKLYKTQLPVVERAIETAALMLGSDKSRGYCLEMICADFLAGANLENENPEVKVEKNQTPALVIASITYAARRTLEAIAAGAPEIWVFGNHGMTAVLADEPTRPLQHQSEVITQNTVRTVHYLFSHGTLPATYYALSKDSLIPVNNGNPTNASRQPKRPGCVPQNPAEPLPFVRVKRRLASNAFSSPSCDDRNWKSKDLLLPKAFHRR